MKISTILFSTVAAQPSSIDLNVNDRSLTTDESLRSIEIATRYLISADQAYKSGLDQQGWIVLFIFDEDLNATVKEMFQYGCWGQVFNDIQGHGEPVDAFDQLAKDWRHCRACTQIDHGCPKTTNYTNKYEASGDMVMHPAAYHCANNQSDCKMAMCSCDVHFATEMAKLYTSGERINPAYHGSGFDHAAKCGTPSSSGRPGPAKQCCGTYPQRTTYDVDNHDCCANTLLVAIGECA